MAVKNDVTKPLNVTIPGVLDGDERGKIWLALAFEVHVHHRAARAWFDAELDVA